MEFYINGLVFCITGLFCTAVTAEGWQYNAENKMISPKKPGQYSGEAHVFYLHIVDDIKLAQKENWYVKLQVLGSNPGSEKFSLLI